MTTTEKKAPRRTRNRQPLTNAAAATEARAAAKAAKTPPQMDATGTLVAPAERRRRAVKEPAEQAPVSIGSRRCTGSKTFGIPEHQAPVADFPVQPSRKDGLGTMCKPHWTEYTGALRKAAIARKADQAHAQVSDDPAVASGQLDGLATIAPARRQRAAKPAPDVDPDLLAAKALVDEVDRLPAPEAARRSQDDDVQAALEKVAHASLG